MHDVRIRTANFSCQTGGDAFEREARQYRSQTEHSPQLPWIRMRNCKKTRQTRIDCRFRRMIVGQCRQVMCGQTSFVDTTPYNCDGSNA